MQDVHFQESCAVPSTHGRHFLIWHKGDLSKWNRLGSGEKQTVVEQVLSASWGTRAWKGICTGWESRERLQRVTHSSLLRVTSEYGNRQLPFVHLWMQ